MITLIIWSKDRACQLHLLLESIFKFCKDTFDIYILYKTSNNNYEKGYSYIGDLFNVTLIKENNFKNNTIDIFNNVQTNNIAFSTDDTVIYKKPPNIIFDNFSACPNTCFSLRLGFNTLMLNPYIGLYQPKLNLYYDSGDYIRWDSRYYHAQSNYGYPMSLDMHIFERKKMLELIHKFDWYNTNSLEGRLTHYRHEIPFIISFKNSIAVNIPMNNMSGLTESGKDFAYSQEYLNEQYISGKRLSLDNIAQQHIIGCHQEIEQKWIDIKE